MTEQTMVERVARAYYAKLTDHCAVLRPGAPFRAWEDLPEEQRTMQLAATRAGIEAMRDPTEAMWDAGHAALEVHGDSARASCWAFVAMLDAALAERSAA